MTGNLKTLARHWVIAFLYPKPLVGLFYIPRFISHWIKYMRLAGPQKVRLLDMQPCLGDWSPHTPFDAHYFFQGAWLARQLSELKPSQHVDIGSSVLTMSVMSAWVNTIFVDYRPLKSFLPRLASVAGDILNLPFGNGSVNSLSCMHVIEHIGLGRYGEPLNPEGSIKAAFELQRILHPGGRLFLSLPIGRERVNFNAHRIHSPDSVSKMLPLLKLVDFSYVDDEGRFRDCRQPSAATDLQYGCGMFVFEKP
jgi:hypothetical protein